MADLRLPPDLGSVVNEIARMRHHDVRGAFEVAVDHLDAIVGASLSLPAEHVEYVKAAFATDPYLKQLSILWEHRGPRVQVYADSEGADRYA